jgi:hypothetical protein
VRNGSKTIDEVRIARGDDPYPGGIGAIPVIIMPTGPMPLDQLSEIPSPAEQQQHETDMAATSAQAHAQAAVANGASGNNGKKPTPKGKPAPQKTTKTIAVENYPDDEPGDVFKDEWLRSKALRRTGDVFKDVTGRTYIDVDGWIVPQDVL